VPTERDTIFSQRTRTGYVHDPVVPCMGCGGHAGVFSDAMDLAQLMQMLLNKGEYNGKHILSAETVALFTGRATQKSAEDWVSTNRT